MHRFIRRPPSPRDARDSAKTVLWHTAAYFVARVAGAILQLILLVYLTHRLGRTGYGEMALFTAAYAISSTALFSVWRHALVRFLPEGNVDPSKTPSGAISVEASLAMGVAASLAVGLLVIVAGAVIGWPHLAAPVPLAIAVLAGGWVDVNLELLRRQLRPLAYAGLFLSRSLLQVCLVIAGYLLEGSVRGAIVGLALSQMVAALFAPWSFWRESVPRASEWRSRLRASMANWRRFLLYAGPVSLGELSAVGFLLSDRAMLGAWRGYDSAGLYSAAHDLTWMGLHVISLIGFLSFYPLVLTAHGKGDIEGIRRSAAAGGNLLFGLSLASTVGVSVLARPIAMLVLGKDFEDGAGVLIMVLAWVHFIYVTKVYWLDLRFQLALRTLPLLAIGLVSLALNILLNIAFIPRYGTTGAAFATAVTATAACAVTFGWSLSLPAGNRLGLPPADVIKLFSAAAFMAAVLWLFPPIQTPLELALAVVSGAIVFLASCFALRLSLIASLRQTGTT